MPPLPDPRPLRVLGQDLSAARRGPAAVASGLASGEEPAPQLATLAVHRALERAGSDSASGILLFLTADFARNTQATVTAASRAGHCLQVSGCCVSGLFTEDDWLIDRPGAAALVFTGDIGLAAPQADRPVFSLARPEAASSAWLGEFPARFGGLAADAGPVRPAPLWQHGKVGEEAACSGAFDGVGIRIGVSRGLRILNEPAAVTANGYELSTLGGQRALDTLLRVLPLELRDRDTLPLHLLYAGVVAAGAAATDARAAGRYTLLPLLAANAEFGTLTLAAPLPADARVFWALRQPLGAEQDMRDMLDRLAPATLRRDPAFALMFSCMGRGPYFYGGADRDLDLVRRRFPDMPLLGAYCPGEIAPLPHGNALIHNSVVLALCERDDVQSES